MVLKIEKQYFIKITINLSENLIVLLKMFEYINKTLIKTLVSPFYKNNISYFSLVNY